MEPLAREVLLTELSVFIGGLVGQGSQFQPWLMAEGTKGIRLV